MATMLIRKLNPDGTERARYTAEVIARDAASVTVRAAWTRPRLDLGYVVFEPGDTFVETFYADRWHNVFEITGASGALKGWYADLTRPARITDTQVDWEDLALDVWMSPRGALSVLDEDEFAALEPALRPGEAIVVRHSIAAVQGELWRRWRARMNDRIADGLIRRGWTIGTAESCTGGLVGDALTDRAGSSAYYLGGIVAYSNRLKHSLLGVQAGTLARHGAVSEACAREMAAGARAALGVDVGVSVTGIAGPGGEGPDKPVGLVYIGLCGPDGEAVERHVWPHDRLGNKRATADQALRALDDYLK